MALTENWIEAGFFFSFSKCEMYDSKCLGLRKRSLNHNIGKNPALAVLTSHPYRRSGLLRDVWAAIPKISLWLEIESYVWILTYQVLVSCPPGIASMPIWGRGMKSIPDRTGDRLRLRESAPLTGRVKGADSKFFVTRNNVSSFLVQKFLGVVARCDWRSWLWYYHSHHRAPPAKVSVLCLGW